MALLVSEIFSSIQGESTHAGRPCSFIRLAGCNLSCKWCDTPYARDGGIAMSCDEIAGQVSSLGIGLVEVTGGEPLLQDEAPTLVKALLEGGFEVLIETNGSLDITRLDRRAKIIMDVKCPSSGESGSNLWENLNRLSPHDEVKFVIAQKSDFDYAKNVINDHPEIIEVGQNVHFAPVFGVLSPAELACWILSERLPVRLGFQLHKYVWDPAARGV